MLGVTGSGKSTKARELLNSFQRAFVVLPGEDPAFEDYGRQAETLPQIAAWSGASSFRIRYVSEHPLAFEWICRLAWERQNCVVMVDEIHNFVPNIHGGIPPWFKKIVLRGRHRNVSIIGISQRPANVHNDFLSEAAAQQLFVFRLAFPTDLDALKKIVPDVYRAQHFKVGEHIRWSGMGK